MWPFESWEEHLGQLLPGKRYRIHYRVLCANGASAEDVSSELARRGILFRPSAGILAGSMGVASDEAEVRRSMSQDEFEGSFKASFEAAAKDAWIPCLGVEISRFDIRVPGSSGFGPGFMVAVGLMAVVIGGVVYLGRKA